MRRPESSGDAGEGITFRDLLAAVTWSAAAITLALAATAILAWLFVGAATPGPLS